VAAADDDDTTTGEPETGGIGREVHGNIQQ
jgi:hypothetical protein